MALDLLTANLKRVKQTIESKTGYEKDTEKLKKINTNEIVKNLLAIADYQWKID